jgi:hypothetical protein
MVISPKHAKVGRPGEAFFPLANVQHKTLLQEGHKRRDVMSYYITCSLPLEA